MKCQKSKPFVLLYHLTYTCLSLGMYIVHVRRHVHCTCEETCTIYMCGDMYIVHVRKTSLSNTFYYNISNTQAKYLSYVHSESPKSTTNYTAKKRTKGNAKGQGLVIL